LKLFFKHGYNDRDNIRKLVFEELYVKPYKIRDALERILQEKSFPYEWIANSLSRKNLYAPGNITKERYYNWTEEMLIQVQIAITRFKKGSY
jgi:hypothetical protein